MIILTRIQNLCTEHNMNLRQLEKVVGIGNGVIKKWGESSPTVSKLCKVTEYFDVSFDYIIGNTDIKNLDNYLEQIENSRQYEVQKLENIIGNLLSELNNQNLTFNDKPIDSDIAEIIQSTLKSNLEVWKFMDRQNMEK